MRFLTMLVVVILSVPVAAKVYHVARGHPRASDDNPGTAQRPWKTIGKAAALAQPGDRVVVHAGTYREWVEPRNSGLPDAPIIYEAAEGEQVVLTGADVLTGFERLPGERPIYSVKWPYRFIINHVNGKPVYHHPGDEKHRRSGRAEQLIVDGQVWDWPQIVLSLDEVKPGTFFPDVERGRLYLWLPDGSDPNKHHVEASTRRLIFGTNPWRRKEGFNYTHVRGFTFRHAANFAQRPAVWLLGKGNVVEDCVIEWMSGAGVGVGPEDGVLRSSIIRNCGHTGGCAGGRNFVNEDCVWENNCRKPISRGWDAGGVKICKSGDGIFQRCVFRNNGGPGLWLDIDDNSILVRNCLFVDNECQGLFVEISRNIYIVNNAFFRNGLRATSYTWGIGGLTLAESRNCVVSNNLFVGNLDGIALREQGPRYLDTPDLGRWAFLNVGHLIANNVSAYNRRYQLGLWFDTAFFGRHPADMKKYKTEEEFEATIKREKPERWFDPLKQGLVIERNLYWPGTAEQVAAVSRTVAQGGVGGEARPEEPSAGRQEHQPPRPRLFLYGVPWRVRHREFGSLAAFTRATGWERQGIVADPGLEPTEGGLFRLRRDGFAFQHNFGPRLPVAGLAALPARGR